MCGIFGSSKFITFEKLYNHNKTRGSFAGGSVYIKNTSNIFLRKWEGVLCAQDMTGYFPFVNEYNKFVGHTQAPTGSVRQYNDRTTHPFEHGDWIVAHNGVLENDQQLRKEYTSMSTYDREFDSSDIPVDSAVIPLLLDTLHVGDDVLAIKETAQNLKGTFGCWLYSKKSGQLYLIRSGSTIFANIETGDFSSILVPELCETPLQEGVIYCVTTEGITNVGKFTTNSPFFLF